MNLDQLNEQLEIANNLLQDLFRVQEQINAAGHLSYDDACIYYDVAVRLSGAANCVSVLLADLGDQSNPVVA